MPQLSVRLSAIAALEPNGARVCDIGTDHGYLAIELMRSGVASWVIATDIGEKPLENARKNLEVSGVESVELRLCDGLSGISPNEVDTVIIAGMGGEVISGILKRGEKVAARQNVTVILQPTTSPEALRQFLCEEGYEILKEAAVFENGKLYSVMLVKFTGSILKLDPAYYYAGKVTPETKAGLLYIEKQRNRCYKCMRALENVPTKKDEYNNYKSAFEGLENILGEFGEN